MWTIIDIDSLNRTVDLIKNPLTVGQKEVKNVYLCYFSQIRF